MAMERSFGCIALDRPGEALRLYADSEVLEAVRRALAKGKSSIGEDAGQRLAALLQRALGAEETARPGEGIVVAASAEAALELVRRALAATGGRLGPVPQRQGAGHLREQPERSDGKRARGPAGEERQSPRRSDASPDDANEEPNAWQVELRPDSAWSWRPASGAGAGGVAGGRAGAGGGAGADAGGRSGAGGGAGADAGGRAGAGGGAGADAGAGGGAGADAGGRAGAGEGAGAAAPAKRGAPGGHAARRLLAVGSLASGVPGLGAAWASGPPELLRRVREEQRRSGAASGWELLVMEELLGLGELEPRRGGSGLRSGAAGAGGGAGRRLHAGRAALAARSARRSDGAAAARGAGRARSAARGPAARAVHRGCRRRPRRSAGFRRREAGRRSRERSAAGDGAERTRGGDARVHRAQLKKPGSAAVSAAERGRRLASRGWRPVRAEADSSLAGARAAPGSQSRSASRAAAPCCSSQPSMTAACSARAASPAGSSR